MIIMKCDRCGKTYVTNHNKHVEHDGDHILTGLYLTRFGEEPSKHIDLCDSCIYELCAFIDMFTDEDLPVTRKTGKGETYKGEFDDE